MRFWPFNRKPAPEIIPDEREMNADWRAGDLAECLTSDWPPSAYPDPKRGDVLRVSGVDERVATHGRKVLIYVLTFEGRGRHGWNCTAFRKITAPETEISRQIKACKPVLHPSLNPSRHSVERA